MSDLLKQTLEEVASLASGLAKQVSRTAGQCPELVTVRAIYKADKLRSALRKLVNEVEGASSKSGGAGL